MLSYLLPFFIMFFTSFHVWTTLFPVADLFTSYRYSFYKDKRHASDSSASLSKNAPRSQGKGIVEFHWNESINRMDLQFNNILKLFLF